MESGKLFIDYLLKTKMFRPKALASLSKQKEEGARIVLVSASPEEWIAPFANHFSVEYIATRLEYDDKNRFLGKFSGKNCNGPEKVLRILESIPDAFSYDISAYGDSDGDGPMLSFAHQSFFKPFR